MILGLSHIGLTASDLESSLEFYRGTFGFQVLSDAERRGEWIDRITDIPGFHSRTVYLSAGPHRHLEVFQFFNPKTIPRPKEATLRAGILYAAIAGHGQKSLGSHSGKEGHTWSDLMGDFVEEPCREDRVTTVQDPDGLFLRIVEPGNDADDNQMQSGNRLMYPGIIVNNLDRSLAFYRDILGLEINDQGEACVPDNRVGRVAMRKRLRWARIGAPTGPCLRLIQPLNIKPLPARPWKMQRVGFTHVTFAVKDLEERYVWLTEKGLNFRSAPQPVSAGPHQGGRAAYLLTNDGTMLELLESPLVLEEVVSSKTE